MALNFRTAIHRLGNNIPEGQTKNQLRELGFPLIFTTFGYKEVQLGPSSDKVPAKMANFAFYKQSLGTREIEGYLQHYQPKPGDTIINAGAYHGYFAIYLAKKIGPTGKIICIEPDKNNRRILRKNIELNQLKNIVIISKGLWSTNTELPFVTMGSGSRINTQAGSKGIKVTSLDNLVSSMNLESIDFISMDIEGAEIEAVKGAKNTLLSNPDIKVAIASYHQVDGKQTANQVEKLLKQYGFPSHTAFPAHLTTYNS